MKINPALIQKDFPEIGRKIRKKTLTYLDSAASTLKVQSVINAVNKHYTQDAANIHRGVHYLSEQGTIQYEETRDVIQNFIGAKERHEIIFTKGTTESINLVAFSFGEKFIEKNDVILISEMEHHSNIVPWQLMAERKGAIVKAIPIDDNGDLIIEEYKKLLTPKVKLVSVAHVSNALGTINPIEEMIKLAHINGSKFLVDAAQSASHLTIDVQKLDCDFLVFSAHKMFGPTGVGVLYGKEKLLNAMPPYQGGGDMIDVVTIEKTTFNTLPHKFEAGTPNIAGVIAFKEALNYISALGLDQIDAYEHELLNHATKLMSQVVGLKIIGTAKKKSAVISFMIDGAHPHDLGTLLDQQGIAIRTGHHCTQPLMKRLGVSATARVSFSIYNTKEDIEILVAGLNKAKEFL
ncbi:MAG: cysteine desulfurase [Bacteriovoracaceae bacterium]|nr:cysteine desulfurase [Bacteriovoracaceae bacterium]